MNILRKIKARFLQTIAYFVIAPILISCGHLPDMPGIKMMQLGNKNIEIFIRQHANATHTVVFENGARNCIQSWQRVLEKLPEDINVFAYNRPGNCGSSKPSTPRTSDNIVNELRTILSQQKLKPPYILVGHSIGGLFAQHFARQHPSEVHGMVLVDSMYPGFLKSFSEFPWYAKAGMYIFLSKSVREEIALAHTSGLLIDALSDVGDKPIVRMFNQPSGEAKDNAIAVDFGMFNRDDASTKKVQGAFPRAKIMVLNSSHQMQETSADKVVQAITEVRDAQGPFQ